MQNVVLKFRLIFYTTDSYNQNIYCKLFEETFSNKELNIRNVFQIILISYSALSSVPFFSHSDRFYTCFHFFINELQVAVYQIVTKLTHGSAILSQRYFFRFLDLPEKIQPNTFQRTFSTLCLRPPVIDATALRVSSLQVSSRVWFLLTYNTPVQTFNM